MTVRVVLADDQPLVRSGLRVLMADHPDLDVVGGACADAEAVQLAREVGPDVVVRDIRMPGMGGIEATRLIMAGPATPLRPVPRLAPVPLRDMRKTGSAHEPGSVRDELRTSGQEPS